MLVGNWKGRLKCYLEVSIVSLIWFAISGGGAAFLLSILPEGMKSWWVVALVFIPVFLLPYLVISSRLWGVNLTAIGARGERAIIGPDVVPSEVEE